jgi:hypothetical protein
MASIITATTTSGLTQSADNSGVLQLASGSGNLVTVPSVTGTAMVSGNQPAFSAYQSSAQTLSSTTYTKINFQTEEWDTANCFDSTTNMRFTPNVAGYYQINGGISSNSSATGIIVNLYKNGSSHRFLYFNGFGSFSNSNGGFGSAVVYMNGSTDYVELYGYFTTGQPVSTGINNAYFQGTLIRTA